MRVSLLVRLVDVVDGEDGEVAVIAEVAERNAGAGLDALAVDRFLRDIEGDGDAKEASVGESAVLDDAVGC